MVYIKLLLIILLCVVYYNEATYQIDIDKSDCEKYYNTVKENITDLFNGSKLYHTQISCYLCIFAEINLQLDLIEILSNANNKIETVNKFKSDMELFKSRFGNWKNLCDKGMPTDTRKSFFAIYTTRYKTSLQQNNPIDVEKCMMSSFTRVKSTDQFSINKYDWERYYIPIKKIYYWLISRDTFYHTQISCYLCILTEINRQLELIKILSNVNYNIETVNKFKSDMELFKSRFGNWKNLCDKGMPTNTRKTFFTIYTSAHYKVSLQQNNPINIEEYMSLFTREKCVHSKNQ